MSMYGMYIKEKTNDEILETDKGFATYRYLDEGKTVYIVDLYVMYIYRKQGVASTIADMVVEEAKVKGCTKLLGSVVPSAKDSSTSLRVLLAYGMTLDSSANDLILFRKDI